MIQNVSNRRSEEGLERLESVSQQINPLHNGHHQNQLAAPTSGSAMTCGISCRIAFLHRSVGTARDPETSPDTGKNIVAGICNFQEIHRWLQKPQLAFRNHS
jgi:hypothetical protein